MYKIIKSLTLQINSNLKPQLPNEASTANVFVPNTPYCIIKPFQWTDISAMNAAHIFSQNSHTIDSRCSFESGCNERLGIFFLSLIAAFIKRKKTSAFVTCKRENAFSLYFIALIGILFYWKIIWSHLYSNTFAYRFSILLSNKQF